MGASWSAGGCPVAEAREIQLGAMVTDVDRNAVKDLTAPTAHRVGLRLGRLGFGQSVGQGPCRAITVELDRAGRAPALPDLSIPRVPERVCGRRYVAALWSCVAQGAIQGAKYVATRSAPTGRRQPAERGVIPVLRQGVDGHGF